MPWIIFLLTCRFMSLTAAFQGRHFSASWAEKEFSPRCRGNLASVYLTKPFCAPRGLSALPVLADLLLLLRETSITSNTSPTTARPIMVKWDAMAGREQHLLPCKSESVVSCSGCCDKTRSRGRASRWCVSIRLWRGTAHIWCGLYLLPALLLDDCRLSSFCKLCTASEATKRRVCHFFKE